MYAIKVDGVALHYRLEGPEGAPVLVFSNSLGTDFRVWDRLLPHLPNGLRILRYDKRGHGLSDCPPGPWGMDDHVADLAGLMDALVLRDAAVCGLSVGGMIAQGLAAKRPDLVRLLILSDTAAKIGTHEMWDQRLDAARQGGIAALADATMERWFTAAFRVEAPDYPLWRNMLLRSPLDGYVDTGVAIRNADLRASTARLRLPCLAVAGSEDGSTPPEMVSETAALIPGSQFEVIHGAGHIPGVEKAETLGRLITAFLKENGHV